MIRAWIAGRMARLVQGNANTAIAAATLLCDVSRNSSASTTSIASAPKTVCIIARSASRAPTRLPAVMPRPQQPPPVADTQNRTVTFVIIRSSDDRATQRRHVHYAVTGGEANTLNSRRMRHGPRLDGCA